MKVNLEIHSHVIHDMEQRCFMPRSSPIMRPDCIWNGAPRAGGGTGFPPGLRKQLKRLQVLCIFILGEGHHGGEMEVVPHPVGAQSHLLTIIRQPARVISQQAKLRSLGPICALPRSGLIANHG
jgi:hypothetical protein